MDGWFLSQSSVCQPCGSRYTSRDHHLDVSSPEHDEWRQRTLLQNLKCFRNLGAIRTEFPCEQAQGTICTHVKTHKLLQVCKQVVTNLFTSCQQVVFALLVPSCCNNFGTSCWQLVTSLMALSDLSQGCSNKSDTVMINKNVTRLTTQGCNNTG
jgi:hypothetical protein